MTALLRQASSADGKSSVVRRVADLLQAFPLETLLDLEDRLLDQREHLRARRAAFSTLNLTILEVALLVSFRRLPDDPRRSDVVNALATFVSEETRKRGGDIPRMERATSGLTPGHRAKPPRPCQLPNTTMGHNPR